MPAWLIMGLEMLGLIIAILVIYNLLKIYVISKIHANKWVVLASAVIMFMIPIFLRLDLPWNLIPSAITVILLLWFMDLSGLTGKRYVAKSKKDEIVMKPKAKPNRVKNNK
jgi:hypothetical protein